MIRKIKDKLPPVPARMGGWVKFALLATVLYATVGISLDVPKDLTQGIDLSVFIPPVIYWLAVAVTWLRKKERDMDYYLTIGYIALFVAVASLSVSMMFFRAGEDYPSYLLSKAIGTGIGVCLASTGFCIMEHLFTRKKK